MLLVPLTGVVTKATLEKIQETKGDEHIWGIKNIIALLSSFATKGSREMGQ